MVARRNSARFLFLASVAFTYLGAPQSSVPSEHFFCTAGAVITEQSARLLSQNAEKLIFLKYNADLI